MLSHLSIQNMAIIESLELDLNKNIIKISALNGEGIDEINAEISRLFKINEIDSDNGIIVTNVRHKNLINKAIDFDENAIRSIKSSMPMDICSIDIKAMLECLGEITGENVSENIINEIFAKFCLGK